MSSTVTEKVHFATGRSGQKKLKAGEAPKKPVNEGRVPRVARLMALAIRCERLIDEGYIADQAELARLGHVSTARMSQILNLTLLAPDIQEQILFLPRVMKGCDPVSEQKLRAVVKEISWARQRGMWKRLGKTSRVND